MRIAQEEIFGPVVAIIEAKDFDDAVRLANHTRFGLSASIVTRDLGLAMRFVWEIEAGIVHVNSQTAGAEPQGALRRVQGEQQRQPRAGKGGPGLLHADQDRLHGRAVSGRALTPVLHA
jgi:aldehyde dehydrogenase (NAD+)